LALVELDIGEYGSFTDFRDILRCGNSLYDRKGGLDWSPSMPLSRILLGAAQVTVFLLFALVLLLTFLRLSDELLFVIESILAHQSLLLMRL